MSISLFYLANCPLPFEANNMLDTAFALQYCGTLQTVFWKREVFWFNVDELSDLSQAMSHIHTCLTKRMEFVQNSCKHWQHNATPTFYDTPFDIPNVVKILNDLAELRERLR